LQELRALAVIGDRHQEAVVLAARALDADDVGAEAGEQMRAIGAGDPPAEIEHADALKNTRHDWLAPFSCPFGPEDACASGRLQNMSIPTA